MVCSRGVRHQTNKLLPLSSVRVALLRLFGARIGTGCRFVHPLRVKAPWNLEVGDKCWFGVDVWIYNQAPIRIGSNVCISQGTFLTAGSHDMSTTMDLRVAPIVIEDGVRITSKCVVPNGRDDRPLGGRHTALRRSSLARSRRRVRRKPVSFFAEAFSSVT